YYMQMIKNDEFLTLSDRNRVNLIMVPPVRGNILDRHGKLLAINHNSFRVMLDKRETKSYKDSLHLLFDILNINKVLRETTFNRVVKSPPKAPIVVFDNITWQEVAYIEENAPYLPGIFIDVAQFRFYPYSALTSHVIGYTGIINDAEKKLYNFQNLND